MWAATSSRCPSIQSSRSSCSRIISKALIQNFAGVLIGSRPDGQVDHALLFGFETDRHRCPLLEVIFFLLTVPTRTRGRVASCKQNTFVQSYRVSAAVPAPRCLPPNPILPSPPAIKPLLGRSGANPGMGRKVYLMTVWPTSGEESGVPLWGIRAFPLLTSDRAGDTFPLAPAERTLSVFFLWVCWAPSKHLIGFGAIASSSSALKERLSSVRVGTCVRRRGQVAIT